MLIAVIAIGPVYVAAMCATGMALGRRFRRLGEAMERAGPD